MNNFIGLMTQFKPCSIHRTFVLVTEMDQIVLDLSVMDQQHPYPKGR